MTTQRIQIYGGPRDGSTLEVRAGSDALFWINPEATIPGSCWVFGCDHDHDTEPIKMPIVDGYAIWPQEKGDTR